MLNLIYLLIIGLITSILSSVAAEKSWFGNSEFLILQKVYDDCQDKNDFTGCLKDKAVTAVTKAIDQDNVKVIDGLYFQRQNQTENDSIIHSSDARLLSSLSPEDRGLLEKLDKFLRTHVIKIDLSEGRGGGGGGGGGGGYGGGGGKKKGGGEIVKYIVAALMTAIGIAGPLALKVLAMIAGKALIISKVALTIAGIIALKKLFSHDNHEEASIQVHASEHNRRNTYVVRPLKVNPTVDPYRYYYEYGGVHK